MSVLPSFGMQEDASGACDPNLVGDVDAGQTKGFHVGTAPAAARPLLPASQTPASGGPREVLSPKESPTSGPLSTGQFVGATRTQNQSASAVQVCTKVSFTPGVFDYLSPLNLRPAGPEPGENHMGEIKGISSSCPKGRIKKSRRYTGLVCSQLIMFWEMRSGRGANTRLMSRTKGPLLV
jgi:hypothetical protein